MIFPIIFLGTDDFSLKCLNSLIDHSNKGSSLFDIRGVITQVIRRKSRGMHLIPSPVAKKAKNLSIPLLMPTNLKDPHFLSQVKAWQSEWAILLSYGKVLPPEFLSLFPQKALNFHASLLPRWRGAAPVQRAIMAGDKTLGFSLQVMTKGLDKGPIIGMRSFELTKDMDAFLVFDKMAVLMEELITQDMLQYMQGQKKPLPQDESQATYAPKIDKKESQIIWSKPAQTLFNQIRALVKGPAAYTLCKGKRIKIYKTALMEEGEGRACEADTTCPTPGEVVEVRKNHFIVACGDNSFLSILTLQPESKKIMSAGDYIRGYGLKSGEVLVKK